MFLLVPGRLGPVDWSRLGPRVTARRGSLGLSREQLAERAGVDASTIAAIETEARPRRAQTIGRLERALGWAEGSGLRIVAGGEPEVVNDADHVASTARRGAGITVDDPSIRAILDHPGFSNDEKVDMLLRLERLRADAAARAANTPGGGKPPAVNAETG